jgi:concentrative nucleoside transporter, CNT family
MQEFIAHSPFNIPYLGPKSNLMSGTPTSWRLAILAVIALLGSSAYLVRETIGTRGQAACGIVVFIGFVAAASSNLRAVSRQTLIAGILLQFGLALAVIHVPYVRSALEAVGTGVKTLLDVSKEGSKFVFGPLADPGGPPIAGIGALGGGYATVVAEQKLPSRPFIFAFVALPPIIFVSAFFSLLYYFGLLQLMVRAMARLMMVLMRTSGAETLAVSANVFMGQTEAPLIVKPYVPRMTQSELLALMASGMATISGGMMAVYISYGADPVAILTTCVMACPCSLYLSKLLLPETITPETYGNAKIDVASTQANPIDAVASGTTDGLKLALNVAAMLISFLALVALFNVIIGGIKPFLLGLGLAPQALGWWPDNLSLQSILGWLFRPAAFFMGVEPGETQQVGTLLGMKLVLNEHVAYVTMTKTPEFAGLSDRSRLLAVYALSGFANFASVGIQLGGIGALAENRRADLARLGMRALFVGFVATLVNAAVAGLLLDSPARP